MLADPAVAEESRECGREVGERLKRRVFETVFPRLAQGFVEDRKRHVGGEWRPSDDQLRDIHEATLTLLYRLLFLFYAESRDLLPIREAPYRAQSFAKIAEKRLRRVRALSARRPSCTTAFSGFAASDLIAAIRR